MSVQVLTISDGRPSLHPLPFTRRATTLVRPSQRPPPPAQPQRRPAGDRRSMAWNFTNGQSSSAAHPVSEAKIGKYVAFLSMLCRTAAGPSHAEACTGPPMQHIMMCFVLATVPAGLLCAAPHAQGERRAARQAFPPLSPPQRLERLPTWQAKRYKLWPRRSDVLLPCARF